MAHNQKLLGILAFSWVCLGFGAAHAASPPGSLTCLSPLEAATPSFTCCSAEVGAETYDCDGNAANGCECRPSDTCHVAKCAGTGCSLDVVADGTYCPAAPVACPGMGVCFTGVCGCPGGSIHGGVDMAHGPGAGDTGCSYSSTTATTGAGLAFALLGVALVLAVRRRQQ